MDLASRVLATSLERFHGQKRLADGAIAQLANAQLHDVPLDDGNSIAILMKHLAGNMRSRWTDFLTSDGEKPARGRDGEFIDDLESREQLDALWEGGWGRLFETLGGLSGEDLLKTVQIRGASLRVIDAVLRQLAHYGYHVGQIVQLARGLKGTAWVSLSIARGASRGYDPTTA
jgi:hypothetical protein